MRGFLFFTQWGAREGGLPAVIPAKGYQDWDLPSGGGSGGTLLRSPFKEEFALLRGSKCSPFRMRLSFWSRATLFPGRPPRKTGLGGEHSGMANSVQWRIHLMGSLHSGGSHWVCWNFLGFASFDTSSSCPILPSSPFPFMCQITFSNWKMWRLCWSNSSPPLHLAFYLNPPDDPLALLTLTQRPLPGGPNWQHFFSWSFPAALLEAAGWLSHPHCLSPYPCFQQNVALSADSVSLLGNYCFHS